MIIVLKTGHTADSNKKCSAEQLYINESNDSSSDSLEESCLTLLLFLSSSPIFTDPFSSLGSIFSPLDTIAIHYSFVPEANVRFFTHWCILHSSLISLCQSDPQSSPWSVFA